VAQTERHDPGKEILLINQLQVFVELLTIWNISAGKDEQFFSLHFIGGV
jgi:hypothetical protein